MKSLLLLALVPIVSPESRSPNESGRRITWCYLVLLVTTNTTNNTNSKNNTTNNTNTTNSKISRI